MRVDGFCATRFGLILSQSSVSRTDKGLRDVELLLIQWHAVVLSRRPVLCCAVSVALP